MLLSGLLRGALGGAAGATVLNAVTYTDMVVRGRPASGTPEDSAIALADRLGVTIAGDDDKRANRIEALGALQGIASGVAVGAVAGWLHDHGVRLPRPVAATLIGAGAMAVSDAGMAWLGVTDLRTWTARDWASDAVPHLAFGWATAGVIRAGES